MNACYDSMAFDGPYKATNIWNEIVGAFRAGLPTRRHRRNLRFHDDCFTASDAVDWLLDYLNRNPNFDIVSRDQTVQLLGKFLKSNVIEDVRGGKIFTVNQVVDNKDLYRFSRFSPTKCPRIPLKTCTNTTSTNSRETVIQKMLSLRLAENDNPKGRQAAVCKTNIQSPKLTWQQLPSVAEVENIWRKILLEKLGLMLNVNNPEEDIFNGVFVNAKHVIHNSTRIEQSGIVESLDKSRELPHWVLSAMKCLMSWPKASGVESCLPNYPGFERDVFKVVRDYFKNLDEPLTTVPLYNMLSTVYVLAEQFDASMQQRKVCRDSEPLTVLRETKSIPSVDIIGGRLSKACISDQGRKGSLTPAIIDVDLAVSCPNLSGSKTLSNAPSEKFTFLCFETDFETDSPVTHIVHPLNNARPMRAQSVLYIREPETVSFSPLTESPRCNSVDAIDLHHDNRAKKTGEAVLKVLLNDSGGYVNLSCNENFYAELTGPYQPTGAMSRGYVNLGCTELSTNEDLSRCSGLEEDGEHPTLAKKRVLLKRSLSSSALQVHAEVVEARKPDLWTWNPPDKCLRHYGSEPDIHTLEGKRLAVEALQLCLLMLPPDNRRNLHRLLRFMVKMAENKQLQLDVCGLSNKKLVLDTFCRSVLRPVDEADLDIRFSARFVAFLVNNHEVIMEAPLDLIAGVKEQLAVVGTTKKRTTTSRALTYCEQVSKAEFERQKRSVSERAVADLLDGIVADRHLTDHDKRKKLKQFKKMYPMIYAVKFPLETGATRKQSAYKKPFQKLLEMRL